MGDLAVVANMKAEIQQTIDDPRSNQDPPINYVALLEFLKTEGCEKNLEFINDLKQYRALADCIYPVQITDADLSGQTSQNAVRLSTVSSTSPSPLGVVSSQSYNSKTHGVSFDAIEELLVGYTSGEQIDQSKIAPASIPTSMQTEQLASLPGKIKVAVAKIVDTYIRDGASSEVILQTKTKKQILTEFQEKNYNPDIFVMAVNNTLDLLRMGPYAKYLAQMSNKADSGGSSTQATEPSARDSRASTDTSKIVAKNSIPEGDEDASIPFPTTITIKQLISNPHSNQVH
eukprot:jgi/Hompol1/1354/HPOL_001715-RA